MQRLFFMTFVHLQNGAIKTAIRLILVNRLYKLLHIFPLFQVPRGDRTQTRNLLLAIKVITAIVVVFALVAIVVVLVVAAMTVPIILLVHENLILPRVLGQSTQTLPITQRRQTTHTSKFQVNIAGFFELRSFVRIQRVLPLVEFLVPFGVDGDILPILGKHDNTFGRFLLLQSIVNRHQRRNRFLSIQPKLFLLVVQRLGI
mmetsp:Transcript_48617/g.80623  ORF Transcript_48617/g.80623 Transcript_48617/m.80623 type:complete len:202 (+) Transcript_48617:3460-4065(+)